MTCCRPHRLARVLATAALLSLAATPAVQAQVTGAAVAKPIYDEKADAASDIQRAVAQAKASRKAVLVVFGANWCGDCRALDASFDTGTVAPLIAQRYVVVKVDVGRFDRNVGLATNYRVPLRAGIPAVAVLNAEGQLQHATRGGELADARRLGDRGIHDFFAKLAEPAR